MHELFLACPAHQPVSPYSDSVMSSAKPWSVLKKLRKGIGKGTKEAEDSRMSERNAKISRPGVSLAALAFSKYAPALHRYIERRVRRPGTALDLTQDIFERFLQIADTDAVRNPQAYLYGIASHVVREALFREDKSLVTYDSDAAEEAGDRLDEALPEGKGE